MTATESKRVLRVAATIRTRHLSEAEARGIDHNLTEEEFAAAVALAELPDAHPRPGERGAWAWGGERCAKQSCATSAPGRPQAGAGNRPGSTRPLPAANTNGA